MVDQPASPARRINDPEGLRRRLVEVAFTAFSTRGYGATPLQELRETAEVTGGALSHHFPTKKALAVAVLRERVAQAVEEAWIDPVRLAPTAAAGVQAAFAGIIADLERNGAVSGCPLGNLGLELSGRDEDFRSAIDEVFARWRGAIADKLRADPNVDGCDLDPDAMATLVVAAYSGAMAMAKASQSAAPLRACAEQLASLMQAESGKPRRSPPS